MAWLDRRDGPVPAERDVPMETATSAFVGGCVALMLYVCSSM